MRLKAYFDDVRMICVYHSGVEIKDVTLYKGDSVLEGIVKEAGFEHTFIYLKEDIDFKARYSFLCQGKMYPIKLRHIVKTAFFEDYFYHDVHDLGNFYKKKKTTFRLWAPYVDSVDLLISGDKIKMQDRGRGIYEVVVDGDLDKMRYRYRLRRYGETIDVIDPYSYSSSVNAKWSVVIDTSKCQSKKIKPKDEIVRYTDAIIYELSIRDMTAMKGLKVKYPKTFKGLMQDVRLQGESTGIPYIKDLGVTHVQIMPVFDFARIDEEDPHGYNWGYDPVAYNVTEGTYTTDPYDPYKRVTELQELIDYIHQNDLYVNLDVVFNHVYEADSFALAKILPYYYFRYRNETELSDGSFCGNELRTEGRMCRDYLCLMVERYIDLFDIDGLRFDLMSLIDVTTLTKIRDIAKTKKPYFMMYGEAWTMDCGLPKDQRSDLNNYKAYEGIAYFDGSFRDEVRGNTYGKEYPGYINGDLGRKDAIVRCLINKEVDPSAHINFLECHDNRTFYDSMKRFHPHESEADDRLRIKLSLAFVILAQGIPFLHSGEEFARTKFDDENSYRSGDKVNMIDYVRRFAYREITYFLKDMIHVRKTYDCLRYEKASDLKSKSQVYFVDELLVYEVDKLKIIINPTLEDRYLYLQGHYKAIYDRDHFVDFYMQDTTAPIEHLSLAILEKV